MENRFLLFLSIILFISCSENETVNPKNIILMIGDGMGLSQISAAYYQSNDELCFSEFEDIGFIKTHSASSIITDSAAGATAFSTGKKTYNGAINMDTDTLPLKCITYDFIDKNIKTGIITTSSVTHATPGCFYGNNKDRWTADEELALQFINSNINLLIGGGQKFFKNRSDNRNLIDSLEQKGYHFISSVNDQIPENTDKLIALCAPKHPKSVSQGRGNFLSQSIELALKTLKNERGFFMVVEGAQIDWGGHDNDSDYIISELLDFDKSIKAALNFAKNNNETLIIVTADHETGGYGITGKNDKTNKLITGFLNDDHTATMVPVFSYGPGSSNFKGIFDNTEIYHKIKELIK